MSDLTINVIKTIKDRQSFKEVLSEVAKGFADCDFFRCADWKAILESTFNANVCAPDTTQFNPEEQNNFCQALDVTNVVGLLESDWQSALEEIMNTDFTADYFESEQTNDENLLNAFYIETCMELHSAEDNSFLTTFQRSLFLLQTKSLKMLASVKDKEEHPPPSIYEIPCATCPATYIGETERPFEVRKEEHQGYVRRREYKQSAIVKHITKNKNHSINWEKSRIIAQERNYKLRKIKEGLFIPQATNPTMNTDKGLKLNNSWQPIIPKLTKIKISDHYQVSSDDGNNLVVES